MGKNKLARWNELAKFDKVIQPEIGDVSTKDHPVKGLWNKEIFKNGNPIILELGCGTGGLLNALKPKRGVGIDFSPAMLEVARKRYPELEFREGDIEQLKSWGDF